MTRYYADERRELPFEETVRLIDNRQRLLDMMNNPLPQGDAPACTQVMSSDDEEENERCIFVHQQQYSQRKFVQADE